MTSIERTAYPRFGRLVTARESDGLVPVAEEVEWARAASRSEEHLLSLVVALKCFQRLGYFPRAGQVPLVMIQRVRGCLGLGDAAVWQPPDRTGRWQQQLVRERLGVVSDPERARSLAEHAIRSEAEVKNHPPDLINVALEVLVREGFELPAFSTLDEIATRARAEVNAGMFSGIVARMRQPEVLRLSNLLDVADGKSGFDGLKRAAGKASWSHFRAQVAYLRWVDSLGDARGWVEGIAESKIADFAGEAAAADAAVMRDVAQPKRTALIGCLVHVAQTRARDELAEMFCKRMAAVTKRARGELDRLGGGARTVGAADRSLPGAARAARPRARRQQ